MSQTNLQHVLKDLEPMKPESQLKVEMDGDLESQLARLLCVYEEKPAYDGRGYWEFYDNYLTSVSKLDLTPKLIERFSQELGLFQKARQFPSEAGLFLTALIQAAYKQGKNGFTIYTAHLNKKIENFGLYLNLYKEKVAPPVKISVIGSLGDDCGHFRFVDLNVSGNVGSHFAADSYKSEIHVSGNCGDLAFFQSGKSKLRVDGNAGVQFGGSSNNSSFVLGGNAGESCGSYSYNCRFEIHGNSGPNLAVGANKSKFICRPPHRISRRTPPVDCVFEEIEET